MEGQIYGVVGITYRGNFSSEVFFLTNRFSIDDYGNPDTVDHLMLSGDMGNQRLGDMLPVDNKYPPDSTL